jgi:hypothetical protein
MPIHLVDTMSIATRSSRASFQIGPLAVKSGAPACFGEEIWPGGPDRRILYAAVVNCQSLGLSAGARWNIPVAAFGKFFSRCRCRDPNPTFTSRWSTS